MINELGSHASSGPCDAMFEKVRERARADSGSLATTGQFAYGGERSACKYKYMYVPIVLIQACKPSVTVDHMHPMPQSHGSSSSNLKSSGLRGDSETTAVANKLLAQSAIHPGTATAERRDSLRLLASAARWLSGRLQRFMECC